VKQHVRQLAGILGLIATVLLLRGVVVAYGQSRAEATGQLAATATTTTMTSRPAAVVPTVAAPRLPPNVTPREPPPKQQTPPPPAATSNPSAPYHLSIDAARVPDPRQETREASIVAIGTVTQVLPARWDTPNGQRPANPFAQPATHSIYTPVQLTVTQYLKGQQAKLQVLFHALGGTVGQDSVEWTADDLYTFHPGDHAVVFLASWQGHVLDGSPLIYVVGHYTITPTGQAVATAHNQTMTIQQGSLQQLIDRVHAAETP
jgi:hypothetical protein